MDNLPLILAVILVGCIWAVCHAWFKDKRNEAAGMYNDAAPIHGLNRQAMPDVEARTLVTHTSNTSVQNAAFERWLVSRYCQYPVLPNTSVQAPEYAQRVYEEWHTWEYGFDDDMPDYGDVNRPRGVA